MTFKLDGTWGFIDNYDLQVVPSGFSYTFSTYQSLLLTPSGSLASGSITFPLNPVDGMGVRISTTQAVGALTLNGNGATVINPATTLSANQTLTYMYVLSTNRWYASNNVMQYTGSAGSGSKYTSSATAPAGPTLEDFLQIMIGKKQLKF